MAKILFAENINSIVVMVFTIRMELYIITFSLNTIVLEKSQYHWALFEHKRR